MKSETLVSQRRSRVPLRARRTLACAAGLFVIGQLLFIGILSTAAPEVRDPEFGKRIKMLRQLMAERRGRQPDVVAVGSSRVAMGIRPETWNPSSNSLSDTPLVFNFGHCFAGPLLEALTVDRLIRAGINPRWLLVEAWPAMLGSESVENCREGALSLPRLDWHDLRFVRQFEPSPVALTMAWAKRGLNPWVVHKKGLLHAYANDFLTSSERMDDRQYPLECRGWLAHPAYDAALSRERYELNLKHTYSRMGVTLVDVGLNHTSRQAYEAIFKLCRLHGIQVAIFIMPESAEFRTWYDRPKLKALENDLQEMCRSAGVQLVDLRDGLDWSNFFDGFHLTHTGAARFTQLLGQRVLDPLLRHSATLAESRHPEQRAFTSVQRIQAQNE